MSTDLSTSTSIFATNVAASTWWVGDLLYRHGPGWSIVPPMLIGAASLVGATRGFLNDRQVRRHKDELHQIEVEKRRGQKADAKTREDASG